MSVLHLLCIFQRLCCNLKVDMANGMAATCLLLSLKNYLQHMYFAMSIEEIGRFLVFFKTELMDSSRLVVICPHYHPLSHTRVHSSRDIVQPLCCLRIVLSNYVIVVKNKVRFCHCISCNYLLESVVLSFHKEIKIKHIIERMRELVTEADHMESVCQL